MNDNFDIQLPLKNKKIEIKSTSKRIYKQKGVTFTDNKFNWLTDGPVNDLEKGLPLITESSYSKIIFNNIDKKENGFIFDDDSPNIIDNIKNIKLKYYKNNNNNNNVSGLNAFLPPSKKEKIIPLPSKRSLSQIVTNKIQNNHLDINESNFPLNIFYPLNNNLKIINEKIEELNNETLLIDPFKNEIKWTKDKIPFTNEELKLFESWHLNLNNKRNKINLKNEKMLIDRNNFIEKTFQSKKAFEKRLELTEKLTKRIINLGPGVGENKKIFPWKIAANEANKDPSSLIYRKKIWIKFSEKIKDLGYINSNGEELFLFEIRKYLINGLSIGEELLFKGIDVLDFNDCLKLKTMKIIDIFRDLCKVSINNFLNYLKIRQLPIELFETANLENKKNLNN